jgi:hypothetical protein
VCEGEINMKIILNDGRLIFAEKIHFGMEDKQTVRVEQKRGIIDIYTSGIKRIEK